MAVIGNLEINENRNKNYNHAHKDKSNVCSIFLHIGYKVIGGETQYFDSSGEHVVHTEIFEHGKFQVGPFDQITHGANHWTEGSQGIILLYTNREIYEHIEAFDTSVFDRWEFNSGEKIKKTGFNWNETEEHKKKLV